MRGAKRKSHHNCNFSSNMVWPTSQRFLTILISFELLGMNEVSHVGEMFGTNSVFQWLSSRPRQYALNFIYLFDPLLELVLQNYFILAPLAGLWYLSENLHWGRHTPFYLPLQHHLMRLIVDRETEISIEGLNSCIDFKLYKMSSALNHTS